jgi:hypothetical protein
MNNPKTSQTKPRSELSPELLYHTRRIATELKGPNLMTPEQHAQADQWEKQPQNRKRATAQEIFAKMQEPSMKADVAHLTKLAKDAGWLPPPSPQSSSKSADPL